MGLGSPTTTQPKTRILSCGFTDPGKVRRVNQDSFFVGEIPGKGYLAVVADGMGGHQTGEVASQKAVTTLRQELQRSRVYPPAAITRAVQIANLAVYNYAGSHPEHQGMGTTLTSVFLDDQVGLVAHVGDSRAYLMRGDQITLLTHDHSWVADQVRQGLLTDDEARRHRWRNIITNALGTGLRVRLDLHHFEAQEGDKILLCSDGVSMLLADSQILQIVNENPPREAARQLVLDANERGGPDNVTAVVVEVASVLVRAKRYDLPSNQKGFETVELNDTMSGIRKVEEVFPVHGLWSKLQRQKWYPYRVWLLGSLSLLTLLVFFGIWR
jgi:serine/threonine protein phosphatase PrpC